MRVSIKHPVTAAVAISATALVLAACGGNDSGNASAPTASGGSGIVSIQSVDGTNVLADSEGRTLYTAEVEKARIHCTGACTSFWEPVDRFGEAVEVGVRGPEPGPRRGQAPGRDRPTDPQRASALPLHEEGAGQLDGDGFIDDFEGTHFKWAAATTGASSAPSEANSSNSPSPY